MKVIASHNGLPAATKALTLLQSGETSPLDAVVEGIELVEDDPDELTVGYGGLPNEDGIVELDAAVMDGATHRGAAVAAMQGIRHPTRVAQLLMQQSKRVFLVGEGAQRFALANGFCEEDLLTERARRMWHYWRRRYGSRDDWWPPAEEESQLDVHEFFRDKFYEPTGTVHVSALDLEQNLACATSTSGHAFKLSGRVGDSPILGAGLYVDNEVGSCGAIGHGEAAMEHCASFAVVELMRGGRSPVEAGLEVLNRINAKSDIRWRDDAGRVGFNLQLFILSADGSHAGVAMWGPKQIAVADENASRLEACVPLFEK